MKEIEQYGENELIFAGKLYQTRLANVLTEAAYYKTLERLCKEKTIARLAKGIYCRPKQGRFGAVLPSEHDIINAFTEKNLGTVIGYALYNSMNLTTQVPRTIEVYSSLPLQQTGRIGNIILKQNNLDYNGSVTRMIHILEVLKDWESIQDLNYAQLVRQFGSFAKGYSNETFSYVYSHIRYPKRTVAFLREWLNYYGINNNLGQYLSPMSDYNYPTMEEIHEAARISG